MIQPLQTANAQNNSDLNEQQTHIVTVAAHTAGGNIEALKTNLPKALDAGLGVNEIKEIMIQMYAYAGFPRSLNGLNAFIDVLEKSDDYNIEDYYGDSAAAISPETNLNKLGEETRTEITGSRLGDNPPEWAKFAPTIDKYLKEHLFGAIFARDVLDHQQRELATIGALAAMDGTEAQLNAHLNFSRNVGISDEQLYDFVEVIRQNVGDDAAQTAKSLLDDITNTPNGKD